MPSVAVIQGKAKSQTVTAMYTHIPARDSCGSDDFAGLNGYSEAIPIAARSMGEFLSEIASSGKGPVWVTGDAAPEFASFCQGEGRNLSAGLEVFQVEDGLRLPSPSGVAVIASRMFDEGRMVPPVKAVPRYYRKSLAEVKVLQDQLDMRIDKMTLADLDRVLEIEALSYKTPWSRRAFTSEVTENSYAHYFVARHEGKIVGYVGMWVILDESHITNIAVDPEFRRHRIGQRLLLAMFEKAKEYGASRMTLEVRVTNTGAQTLYRNLGFADRGLRKGYYTDTNEDAIIMWKDDLGPQKPKAEQVKWMV
jgi:ribosomal-protein-alanine N-acetyltransferase